MTTTAMLSPSLPQSVLDQLTRLGADTCNFVPRADEAGDAFLGICSQMQHFLDEVKKLKLLPRRARNGQHAANGKTVQDDQEVKMSKKKMIAAINGTLGYFFVNQDNPTEIEVTLADLTAIRRCLQEALHAKHERGEPLSVSQDLATELEQDVEKRLNAVVSVQPVTTSIKDLRQEAA